MSLDVHLHSRESVNHECWECGHVRPVKLEMFSANITHNLNTMAEAAGIYKQVWRPEEVGITTARDMIEPLRAGIALLKSDPKRFQAYEPSNGWGRYEHFVPWLERYLEACEQFPDAEVSVSR